MVVKIRPLYRCYWNPGILRHVRSRSHNLEVMDLGFRLRHCEPTAPVRCSPPGAAARTVLMLVSIGWHSPKFCAYLNRLGKCYPYPRFTDVTTGPILRDYHSLQPRPSSAHSSIVGILPSRGEVSAEHRRSFILTRSLLHRHTNQPTKKDWLPKCVCIGAGGRREQWGKTRFQCQTIHSVLPEWFKSGATLCLHTWHSVGRLEYSSALSFCLFFFFS